jgi:hypothetical protein
MRVVCGRVDIAFRCCQFAVALVALGACREALAQNYREVPIGGRTATMGGAGTAAGNDSAMPYLNPAGLAGVPGDIFAISASVYGYSLRTYDNVFFPGSTPAPFGPFVVDRQDVSSRNVLDMPSSVMYFKYLNKPTDRVQQRVGFALVIPSARRDDMVAHLNGRFPQAGIDLTQSLAINQSRTTYYLGPSYAIGVGDNVRLGLSLFTAYTRTIYNQSVGFNWGILGGSVTGNNAVTLAYEDNTSALVPVLGVQVRVAPNVWLGFAGSPPSLSIDGKRSGSDRFSSSLPNPQTGAAVSTQSDGTFDVSAKYQLPWRLNAGIAYDNRDVFSVAADISVYGSGSLGSLNGVERIVETRTGDLPRSYIIPFVASERRETVLNAAVGVEVPFYVILALRAGAFMDRTFMPKLGQTDYFSTRVDHYGSTLGLGIRLGTFDTTMGGAFVYGTGQFGSWNPWSGATGEPSVIPTDMHEYAALFIMSGAVTTEEAKKTIHDTVPFNFNPPDLPGGPATTSPAPTSATPAAVAPAEVPGTPAPATQTPAAPTPATPAPTPPTPAPAPATAPAPAAPAAGPQPEPPPGAAPPPPPRNPEPAP